MESPTSRTPRQGIVTEHPDTVDVPGGRKLNWNDYSALPFGYYKGKFYISDGVIKLSALLGEVLRKRKEKN